MKFCKGVKKVPANICDMRESCGSAGLGAVVGMLQDECGHASVRGWNMEGQHSSTRRGQ